MSGYPSRKYLKSRLTQAELENQLRDLDPVIRRGAQQELDHRAASMAGLIKRPAGRRPRASA